MPESSSSISSQYIPFGYVELGGGFDRELPWEWVCDIPESFLRASPEEIYFPPTPPLSVLFVWLDYLI